MRRYGLIGFPLGHSFSKGYFTAKFEQEGIEEVSYENFPLAHIEELLELMERTPELEGFNVTIPYKEAVIPFLQRLSPEADQVGAVNCVKRTPDGWVGHNTDVAGFAAALDALLGEAQPTAALVLGSGGAAKAVWEVLRRRAIPYTTVSRSVAAPRPAGRISYEELTPEVVRATPLIINTTPLGMFPNVESAPPIPYEAIGTEHYLLDLIYNPAQTRFMALGAERGAAVQGGYLMLTEQAEAAWRIWQVAEP